MTSLSVQKLPAFCHINKQHLFCARHMHPHFGVLQYTPEDQSHTFEWQLNGPMLFVGELQEIFSTAANLNK
jgi:hypothetical protein